MPIQLEQVYVVSYRRGRLKRGDQEVDSKLLTTERQFNVCLPVSTLILLL